MTATEYSKVQRAIEIFSSYGNEVKILSNFRVESVGEFQTADELFTAACVYDIGRGHGFLDGVEEIEKTFNMVGEWQPWDPEFILPCHPEDQIVVRFADGGTTEHLFYPVYAQQYKHNFSMHHRNSNSIVGYKIIKRHVEGE